MLCVQSKGSEVVSPKGPSGVLEEEDEEETSSSLLLWLYEDDEEEEDDEDKDEDVEDDDVVGASDVVGAGAGGAGEGGLGLSIFSSGQALPNLRQHSSCFSSDQLVRQLAKPATQSTFPGWS